MTDQDREALHVLIRSFGYTTNSQTAEIVEAVLKLMEGEQVVTFGPDTPVVVYQPNGPLEWDK